MDNSILKNLEFSTQKEYEEKIETLNKNKQKIELYLMLWFIIGAFGSIIIISFPPTPVAAIFGFVLPLFSGGTQLIEYIKAIETIEANAKQLDI